MNTLQRPGLLVRRAAGLVGRGPATDNLPALRSAVANLYNETYRQGKESLYTHENVCIVPGTLLAPVDESQM